MRWVRRSNEGYARYKEEEVATLLLLGEEDEEESVGDGVNEDADMVVSER
jgi:hypothetical protein